MIQTVTPYWDCPFELPKVKIVGLLVHVPSVYPKYIANYESQACQRDPLLSKLETKVVNCRKIETTPAATTNQAKKAEKLAKKAKDKADLPKEDPSQAQYEIELEDVRGYTSVNYPNQLLILCLNRRSHSPKVEAVSNFDLYKKYAFIQLEI